MGPILKGSKSRKHLPNGLEERLQVVWRRIGHLIDWCNDANSWTKMFRSEARPYRETFYWEVVAEMVSDYMLDHPSAVPEDVLTDCLVAVQCAPSSDELERTTHFRKVWSELLMNSQQDIEAFTIANLELAKQNGTYETVARLYTADNQQQGSGDA